MINIYCDESCHLENDGNNIMLLGAVWCPKIKVKEINLAIRAIKDNNNLPSYREMKWSRLSESKRQAYLDIVSYFFDEDALNCRILIVRNKNALDHSAFDQSHNDWYHKMYFNMLKVIIRPYEKYHIYLDIKDTNSSQKVEKLHDVLCNSNYDFSRSIVEKIQTVRSHEIQIMQLTDILLGALSYYVRGFCRVKAKNEIIELIKKRSGYALDSSTLYREDKFNLFYLDLQEKLNNDNV